MPESHEFENLILHSSLNKNLIAIPFDAFVQSRFPWDDINSKSCAFAMPFRFHAVVILHIIHYLSSMSSLSYFVSS